MPRNDLWRGYAKITKTHFELLLIKTMIINIELYKYVITGLYFVYVCTLIQILARSLRVIVVVLTCCGCTYMVIYLCIIVSYGVNIYNNFHITSYIIYMDEWQNYCLSIKLIARAINQDKKCQSCLTASKRLKLTYQDQKHFNQKHYVHPLNEIKFYMWS